jgi:hypothetical protein
VHCETYKLVRSRLGHRLGSIPSAGTMRLKLMRMSRRLLTVRQLVRFQPAAPRFAPEAHQDEHSAFNRVVVSSSLTGRTMAV